MLGVFGEELGDVPDIRPQEDNRRHSGHLREQGQICPWCGLQLLGRALSTNLPDEGIWDRQHGIDHHILFGHRKVLF